MKHILLLLVVLGSALGLTGCNDNEWREIPAGHIGKILTPKGWESNFREAGSVDIGNEVANTPSNTLTLIESSSVTIKETFGLDDKADPGDHRITAHGQPLSVDVRIQAMVPEDNRIRESILKQINPIPFGTVNRVNIITLAQIYERIAKGTVRNRIRAVFNQYNGYADVMNHYDEIGGKIQKVIAAEFKDSIIPLTLLSAEVSNVTPDEVVRQATNRQIAAEAKAAEIKIIGQAIAENPQYLRAKELETIEATKGTGTTLIYNMDGSDKVGYTLPLTQKK